MNLVDKLSILADSAKYDVSCASSGSRRPKEPGFGATSLGGVCHSWTSDGRCVSLLKILQSNLCVYDCAYCVNRRSNDIRRAMLTPEELARLTGDFYARNYIEGLFLSSAVTRDADYTMEMMVRTARLLRQEYRFNGYIHLKLIPGARPELIEEAGRLADRVSVNIELPTRASLKLLAPDKDARSIMMPMEQVSSRIEASRRQKSARRRNSFAPAGQSTQLIIGATPESDLQIMRVSSWLYERMRLKRVYYSAYVPVNRTPNLPALTGPPLLREHRLYQADWLIRFYGFGIHELLDEADPHFDTAVDPKAAWALKNFQHFPLEVNRAGYEELLRVPGLGVRSVNRIVALRKVRAVSLEDLKKLRVVWKRAQYFLTVRGKYYGDAGADRARVRARLVPAGSGGAEGGQLDFFKLWENDPADRASAITGEL